MLDELDYRAEADPQRAFGAACSRDERLVVPAVVAAAPKVLVSEWADGVTLGAFADHGGADAARRDRHAHTIIEMLLSSPARLGMLHADPHPGNFLVLTDDRLAMIDYGSVAFLPDGVPPALVQILRHVAEGDPVPMMRLLRAEGFVTGDVIPEDVLAYLGALADPLREEHFHFNRVWARRQAGRVVRDRGSWGVGRVLSGWMHIVAQLDCTVPVLARGQVTFRLGGRHHGLQQLDRCGRRSADLRVGPRLGQFRAQHHPHVGRVVGGAVRSTILDTAESPIATGAVRAP